MLLLLAAIAGVPSCDATKGVCPSTLYVNLTVPDTTTIKVGASTIAIAGEEWGGCDKGLPAHDYLWTASDSTVVAVFPFDSIYARIQGVRVGKARVTPSYKATGGALSPVMVTVVP